MEKTISRTPPAKKVVRQRSLVLVVLALVAGSLAFPAPANWVIGGFNRIAGTHIPKITKAYVLGLDLQGGTHLEYEADVQRVADADRADALSGVRDVIERRVNTLGVSEPLVQTTQAGNSWRVTVELAGIRDAKQATDLIGETPILEFKEPSDQTQPTLTADQKKHIDQQNSEAKKRAAAILAAVRQPHADFSAIAKAKTEIEAEKKTGGDLGFLAQQSNQADVYALAKDLPVGAIVNHVIEREHTYAVAKVTAANIQQKEVQAHHLLISYAGAQGGLSKLTREQALAKIQALKKQATPRNFDQLAKQNSQEPGASQSAGDLGWFGKGVMVDAFEKEVFAQRVGTISDVVETPFGFHLIWKIAERPVRDVRVQVIEVKKLTAQDVAPAADGWQSTKLTGKQLASAHVDFDHQSGAPLVALQFNNEGAQLFADLTKRDLGKHIAIFLDGQIISSPVVQTEIVGGNAVIQGKFTINEAKLLARRLQAGALPVPIHLIAEQTVGPTLGLDSLQKSLAAGLAGFALVALFMILLYRLPGLVSVVALLLYAGLSMAVFKLVPVTLTLSGIAGFILSIGIAVDANVLVYERLKEEWKTGKGLAHALEEAFIRAWPSIRDGHVTVLISCAVLYWFSSSIIKGFALTLAIGILISLFTAIVSARTWLRFLTWTPLSKQGWLFLERT